MWTSARRLCPSSGPRARQYYLSSLKSGCVFGQPCQNKRRAVTSKGRDTSRMQWMSVTFQRRKLQFYTNMSELVKLQGLCLSVCLSVCLQARLAHKVCSPHGSFRELFIWTWWAHTHACPATDANSYSSFTFSPIKIITLLNLSSWYWVSPVFWNKETHFPSIRTLKIPYNGFLSVKNVVKINNKTKCKLTGTEGQSSAGIFHSYTSRGGGHCEGLGGSITAWQEEQIL